MRQAIITRYAGATEASGSRILARAPGGFLTHPYNHALSSDQNHMVAAIKLAEKLEWPDAWGPVAGGGPNDARFWVWPDRDDQITPTAIKSRDARAFD